MIPEWLGFRLREVLRSYRWMWRAAQAAAPTQLAGALRFAACVVEDALTFTVWCLATPIRHPAQRDRVVVPAALLAVLMMLSLQLDRSETSPSSRGQVVNQDVAERCGGSIYLGAVAAPGDAHVAFAACSDAVAEAPVWVDRTSAGSSIDESSSRLRLTI